MSPEKLYSIVEKLRAQGSDDAEFEAKACSRGLSKDVWETVSAFGNTRGGTLLLGISEEGGFHLVPKFPLEAVRDQFVEGIGSGGSEGRKVENAPQYTLDRVDFEDGQILVAAISEVEERFKPCYIAARGIANGSFKRVDDKDIRLSATEVYELQHMLEVSLADRESVPATSAEDLDGNRVDSLISGERERGSKALRGVSSDIEALQRLGAIDKGGEVTLAGLLSLGTYPQQYYPKLVVDVAVHPGTEKSEPDAPRFLDRIVCEGAIDELVDDGIHAIAKNLRTFSSVEGAGRKDELEIPREVLREALANALVHREYSSNFIGQSVSVDVFPDRVEIVNPGGLWGGKTIETLADGQSRCRNDSLMRLVSRIGRSEGLSPAEGQGSGIPLMIREMRTHSLLEPEFRAGVDYFKVVLWRSGAELLENREWLNRFAGIPMTRRQEALLLEIRRKGSCTTNVLHKRFGFDSDDIRGALRRLSLEGVVVEEPVDTFSVAANGAPDDASSSKEAILAVLKEANGQLSMREIAERSGRKLPTLRAQMRKLVDKGIVIPTASSTDRNRRYYLA